MALKKCPLCDKDDPPLPVWCGGCGMEFHLHDSQVHAAPADAIMLADCSQCGTHNLWAKRDGELYYLGTSLRIPVGINDLREFTK